MKDNHKISILKINSGKWEIVWNGGFFYVNIHFLGHRFYICKFKLPYYDWKMLALQMLKVDHDRKRGGPEISSVGIGGIQYFSNLQFGTPRGSPKAIKHFRKRLKLWKSSPQRRYVAVRLSQFDISLTQKAFTEFVTDILDADLKLNQFLNRKPHTGPRVSLHRNKGSSL